MRDASQSEGPTLPMRDASQSEGLTRPPAKNVCVRIVHAHTHCVNRSRVAFRKMFATRVCDFRVDLPRRVFRVDVARVIFAQIRTQRFCIDVTFVRQRFRVHDFPPLRVLFVHDVMITHATKTMCDFRTRFTQTLQSHTHRNTILPPLPVREGGIASENMSHRAKREDLTRPVNFQSACGA